MWLIIASNMLSIVEHVFIAQFNPQHGLLTEYLSIFWNAITSSKRLMREIKWASPITFAPTRIHTSHMFSYCIIYFPRLNNQLLTLNWRKLYSCVTHGVLQWKVCQTLWQWQTGFNLWELQLCTQWSYNGRVVLIR